MAKDVAADTGTAGSCTLLVQAVSHHTVVGIPGLGHMGFTAYQVKGIWSLGFTLNPKPIGCTLNPKP